VITTLEAKRSGQFGKGRLIPNVVAGVIAGVVPLPLAVAMASGARPFSYFFHRTFKSR
jgi:SulP family sulfate permease